MTDIETPEVTARVEETWAALEVDGETQTIRADSEEEVRHEVLRRTMQIAAESNTDVNLLAVDRDGEWRLVITPQGDISEKANPTHPHGAHQGADDAVDGDTGRPSRADEAPGDREDGQSDDAGVPAPGVRDETPRWKDPVGSGSDADQPAEAAVAVPSDPEPAALDVLIESIRAADARLESGADRGPESDADAGPESDADANLHSGAEPQDAGAAASDDDADRHDTAGFRTGEDGSTEAVDPGPADSDPYITTIRPIAARSFDAGIGDPAPTNPIPLVPARTPVIPDPPPSSTAAGSTTPGAAIEADDSVSIWETVRSTTPVVSESVVPQPATPAATAPVEPSAGDPPSPAGAPAPSVLPTLADFQATQPPPVAGPATQGWRGAIRRGTGGLISPAPSAGEQRHREAVASVTRSLSGPRTICVINPKGGAHKTTATMLIAATFGLYRGGYTLAWDNNETRGTLGWRAHQARHTNTAVNLLNDIDRFTDLRSARVGDLDNYVRSQAEAQFDVLASDEDAAASSMIDGEAFRRLHETLQRFYRVIVVDTGNNMRASNWEAAIAASDQLVIVSAIREDTAGGAAWMVEGLARKGHDAKLRDAVTILSAPDKNVDAQLRTRLTDHFGSLTRDVVEVPYDSALVSGAGISMRSLAPATREAWLTATATIANGL